MVRKSFVVGVSIVLAGCVAGVQNQRDITPKYTPFVDASGVEFQKISSQAEMLKKLSDLGGPQRQLETNAEFEGRMSRLKPFELCETPRCQDSCRLSSFTQKDYPGGGKRP